MTTPSSATSGRTDRPLIIAVLGGAEPSARAFALAEEVGHRLAALGAVPICGAGPGVMEAVCKGAKAAGGTTIGVIPGDDREEANAYVDYAIVTGMGYARNVIIVKTGRAAIAIDGSYGTLSEIAHALDHGVPVIGLETWQASDDHGVPIGVVRAESAADAVEKAIAAARERDAQEQAASR